MDYKLGIIFIIGNLILLFYLWVSWKNMIAHNEEYEKNVNDNESYLLEILNNIDKIIYRGQTMKEVNIFQNKTNNSIDSAFKFYSNTNYHGIMMHVIFYILIFICVGYIIMLFFQKKIDIIIFITFFTTLLLYRDKMSTVVQQIPDFIEFLGRSDSVLKYFRTMPEDYDSILQKKNFEEDLDFRNIRFENITFKYTTNTKYIFENLTMYLDTDDKIIGITGLSGNGKSTFAKMILKMYRPTAGSIYIGDVNIESIDADYIRKHITYVNQNSKLFDKKVVDNILYGCNDIDVCSSHLKEIMRYPKVSELFKNMDIYNKNAGSLGDNLSGGQRQVVNIISGLVNPSKILILDEPTNALDGELKREILNLIKDFKKHKQCIIIITHDRDVFPLFDEKIEI
jgi:ABC-type bacteriocin/lantibiotic exporter with double-glycine peptidase domain